MNLTDYFNDLFFTNRLGKSYVTLARYLKSEIAVNNHQFFQWLGIISFLHCLLEFMFYAKRCICRYSKGAAKVQ